MVWGSKPHILLGTRRQQHFGWYQRYNTTCPVTLSVLFIWLTISSFRLYLILFSISKPPSFALNTLGEQVCKDEVDRVTVIPNLVHYIWILKDHMKLQIDFKFFITAYSAHLYLQPEIIYFHTDASQEVFQQARASGDKWTRAFLAIPNLKYHYVEAPNFTTNGVPITLFEHKSDFLRMRVLYEFAGMYLDTDAIPLRNITDLRESGFANVVGGAVVLTMKHSGYINNGVSLLLALLLFPSFTRTPRIYDIL